MATAKTKKVSMDRIIKLMQSDDYKDRFKAEYYQLKDRLEKLSATLEKYKIRGYSQSKYSFGFRCKRNTQAYK